MTMSQSFLKDQLKRIREMIEQMAQVHDRATELSHELGRNRNAARHRNPLAEVRDLRPSSSPNYTEPDGVEEERGRAADAAWSARRPLARDSRRRRR
jgi:hypothetical protein